MLGVPLTMAVALAVAVGLNRIERLKGFFRVGYYLPVVTSIVAVSVVWKFLLRDDGGLVNAVLGVVGIDGPAWLDSTTLALPSLVVMAVWRNFGTLMIIFLAALQTVPRELLEAAETDGATAWGRFRHITLPMLRPALLFGAVITSIGYLQFFEEAFVMTKGGPLDSTRSVTFFTFDQWGYGNYGYAQRRGVPPVPRDHGCSPRSSSACSGRRTDMSQTLEPPAPVAPVARLVETDYGKPPKSREGSQRTPRWLYGVMAVGLVLVVIPFIWMVVSSFKPEAEVRAVPPTWWPETVTTDNYAQLFTQLDFPTYFVNSAIVAIVVAAGNMVFCSMLGYALAKLRVPGQEGRLRAGARHADGARRRHLHPAVRPHHQHRARQLAAGHDPAVPRGPVRRLPDAPVHPQPCPTS